MYRIINEEIKNKIEEMYHENKVPVWKIANTLRISEKTLQNTVNERGLSKRNRHCSEDCISKAVAMYEQGKLCQDILNTTGVTSKDLYAEIDNRNIPRRRSHYSTRIKKENPNKKKILALYESGKSRREISLALDLPYDFVTKVLRNDLNAKPPVPNDCHMGNS